MPNKIFVILYGGARLNMFLGTKSLIIITTGHYKYNGLNK